MQGKSAKNFFIFSPFLVSESNYKADSYSCYYKPHNKKFAKSDLCRIGTKEKLKSAMPVHPTLISLYGREKTHEYKHENAKP